MASWFSLSIVRSGVSGMSPQVARARRHVLCRAWEVRSVWRPRAIVYVALDDTGVVMSLVHQLALYLLVPLLELLAFGLEDSAFSLR